MSIRDLHLPPPAKPSESNLERVIDKMVCNLLRPESQNDFRERLSDTHPDCDC